MINIALLFYTGMNVFGKDVMTLKDGAIHVIEYSLFRSAFLAFASYSMIPRYNLTIWSVPSDCVRPLIFRCIIGLITFFIITISI